MSVPTSVLLLRALCVCFGPVGGRTAYARWHLGRSQYAARARERELSSCGLVGGVWCCALQSCDVLPLCCGVACCAVLCSDT